MVTLALLTFITIIAVIYNLAAPEFAALTAVCIPILLALTEMFRAAALRLSSAETLEMNERLILKRAVPIARARLEAEGRSVGYKLRITNSRKAIATAVGLSTIVLSVKFIRRYADDPEGLAGVMVEKSRQLSLMYCFSRTLLGLLYGLFTAIRYILIAVLLIVFLPVFIKAAGRAAHSLRETAPACAAAAIGVFIVSLLMGRTDCLRRTLAGSQRRMTRRSGEEYLRTLMTVLSRDSEF